MVDARNFHDVIDVIDKLGKRQGQAFERLNA